VFCKKEDDRETEPESRKLLWKPNYHKPLGPLDEWLGW
jgi:hypothetical protein